MPEEISLARPTPAPALAARKLSQMQRDERASLLSFEQTLKEQEKKQAEGALIPVILPVVAPPPPQDLGQASAPKSADTLVSSGRLNGSSLRAEMKPAGLDGTELTSAKRTVVSTGASSAAAGAGFQTALQQAPLASPDGSLAQDSTVPAPNAPVQGAGTVVMAPMVAASQPAALPAAAPQAVQPAAAGAAQVGAPISNPSTTPAVATPGLPGSPSTSQAVLQAAETKPSSAPAQTGAAGKSTRLESAILQGQQPVVSAQPGLVNPAQLGVGKAVMPIAAAPVPENGKVAVTVQSEAAPASAQASPAAQPVQSANQPIQAQPVPTVQPQQTAPVVTLPVQPIQTEPAPTAQPRQAAPVVTLPVQPIQAEPAPTTQPQQAAPVVTLPVQPIQAEPAPAAQPQPAAPVVTLPVQPIQAEPAPTAQPRQAAPVVTLPVQPIQAEPAPTTQPRQAAPVVTQPVQAESQPIQVAATQKEITQVQSGSATVRSEPLGQGDGSASAGAAAPKLSPEAPVAHAEASPVQNENRVEAGSSARQAAAGTAQPATAAVTVPAASPAQAVVGIAPDGTRQPNDLAAAAKPGTDTKPAGSDARGSAAGEVGSAPIAGLKVTAPAAGQKNAGSHEEQLAEGDMPRQASKKGSTQGTSSEETVRFPTELQAVGPATDLKAARLAAPAGSPIQQIIDKIQEAVQQGRTSLHMQLNPKDLGAIDIRLVSHGQSVTITMLAEHSSTSQLLEKQMDQLRANLADAGINLANVNIGHQAAHGQQGSHQPGQPAPERYSEGGTDNPKAPPEPAPGPYTNRASTESRIDYRI